MGNPAASTSPGMVMVMAVWAGSVDPTPVAIIIWVAGPSLLTMTGTATSLKLAGTLPRGVLGLMMTSDLPFADAGVSGIMLEFWTSNFSPFAISSIIMPLFGDGSG